MSTASSCAHCGRPIGPSDNFCPWCGQRVPGAVVPPSGAAGPSPAAIPPGVPPPAYPPAYFVLPRRADFSAIFSGTFSVWGRNVLQYFGVYFALTLATGLLGSLIGSALSNVGFLVPGSPAFPLPGTATTVLVVLVETTLVTLVISVVVGSFVLAGVTDFAVRHHRGESPTLAASFARGTERYPSVLGANAIYALATTGLITLPELVLFASLSSVLGGSAASPAGFLAALCGSAVAFLFLAFIVVYLGLALLVYAPAIVMERLPAMEGLRRSWSLTKGHRWSLFAVVLVLGLLLEAVTLAVGVFLPFLVLTIGSFGSFIAVLFLEAAAAGFTSGWFAIMPAVAYDLILRERVAVPYPPRYPYAVPYRP